MQFSVEADESSDLTMDEVKVHVANNVDALA
jgi:hypothetical protein